MRRCLTKQKHSLLQTSPRGSVNLFKSGVEAGELLFQESRVSSPSSSPGRWKRLPLERNTNPTATKRRSRPPKRKAFFDPHIELLVSIVRQTTVSSITFEGKVPVHQVGLVHSLYEWVLEESIAVEYLSCVVNTMSMSQPLSMSTGQKLFHEDWWCDWC